MDTSVKRKGAMVVGRAVELRNAINAYVACKRGLMDVGNVIFLSPSWETQLRMENSALEMKRRSYNCLKLAFKENHHNGKQENNYDKEFII